MTDAELSIERIRIALLPLDDPERAARIRGLQILESLPYERRLRLFEKTDATMEDVFGAILGGVGLPR